MHGIHGVLSIYTTPCISIYAQFLIDIKTLFEGEEKTPTI